ncbi:hypothetical protein [Flavobacterium sp. GSB-24]|uniref:hypothetical protein n=1 Tax=Flavobacterium sp. GSB-24 TaxID=2994319 RepID=UPI002490BD16|nr:hypothetical protein [Flavobacterium sp. GSB-24]BDU25171.1 hypothetical protein FLGSB24_19150 [Flavobacterium sp. GSB-24]
MSYNINDIKIGDEVFFHSTTTQNNHDLYWTVTGFTGNRIHINLDKFGIYQDWTIDIKDVVAHIPV